MGKDDVIVFDEDMPGFGVRLRAGGSRTWVLQYQIGAKQRRMSLGKTAVLDHKAARRAAQKALAKVTLGDDPQAEKQKKRAEAELTVGAIADRFLRRQSERLRPRTLKEEATG